ncbi:MAG TPA: prepilin-type N-terminal cleavage/methylation domain-containing protein [Phycisphaerales bacterium]|nr:prepilin-type N-terminal cleavage/methylation domain-containing protein [Phycisphaerales bacterium]
MIGQLTTHTGTPHRRAFSLIELLVVIVIIAVVISITVPALSGARSLAKKSSSNAQIASLVTAVAQFQADNDRLPGYFSADEMGNGENATRGFTQMENIMLDLIGGPVESTGGIVASNAMKVGPTNSSEVTVDLDTINLGQGSKGYYTPDNKGYLPVDGQAANADHQKLPDVLDAWGMPILAWADNTTGPKMNANSSIQDFARINSDTEPAHYYWNQNAGMLSSTALGTKQVQQAKPTPVNNRPWSLLGKGESNLEERLTALLGSPAFAVDETVGVNSILPSAGRGGIVFQSAGADRVYLSRDDKGFGKLGGELIYGRNFTPKGSISQGQYELDDGTQGSIDIIAGFDDIVEGAGN